MKQTIKARYDGRAIHPDEPLPLPRGTRLAITWQADDTEQDEDDDVGVTTFLDLALLWIFVARRTGRSASTITWATT